MKVLIILMILLSFTCSAEEITRDCLYTNNYESAKYTIKIVSCCKEGELDCDNVYYEGTRKIDKSFIQLKGKTINDYLSHRLLGYQFQNNDYLYIVQDNSLTIYKKNKLLQKDLLNLLHN
jgi:hypothetical protein